MRIPALYLLLAAAMALHPVSVATAQAPVEAGEVTDLKETVEGLPREVLLALHGAKKEQAILDATDVLRKKVEGRPASLKLKVERIEKDQERDEKVERYRVKGDDSRLNKGTTNFVAHLWVHFDPSESPKIAALKKGAQVSITGKVTVAAVSLGTPLNLHIDVSQAKLNE